MLVRIQPLAQINYNQFPQLSWQSNRFLICGSRVQVSLVLLVHKNCIIKVILRLFIISGLCKNVKELLGFWSVKIGSFYGPSSVNGNTVVCETTVQGSNPQRDPIGEMAEQPAKVLVILCGSNPSFSATFMTNCELVVENMVRENSILFGGLV